MFGRLCRDRLGFLRWRFGWPPGHHPSCALRSLCYLFKARFFPCNPSIPWFKNPLSLPAFLIQPFQVSSVPPCLLRNWGARPPRAWRRTPSSAAASSAARAWGVSSCISPFQGSPLRGKSTAFSALFLNSKSVSISPSLATSLWPPSAIQSQTKTWSPFPACFPNRCSRASIPPDACKSPAPARCPRISGWCSCPLGRRP